MDDDDDFFPLVIDNGSSVCRAGFGGDDEPKVAFPSVVGYPRHQQKMILHSTRGVDRYVGDQAQRMRGILTLKYPKEHGIITNWDDMEMIWHHLIYKELCVAPEDHPVFLTEPFFNPKANREKMTQIMFEKFGVLALYIHPDALLPIYNHSTINGVVCSSGGSVTQVVPIVPDRSIAPHGIYRADMGGRDLTNYMRKLLNTKGNRFVTTAGNDVVKSIKEKCSSLSLNYEQEIHSSKQEQTYELSDGQIIAIDKEQFMCPEALFKPSLIGIDGPGIHEMIYHSIMKCDIDLRKDLYSNIVLAGSNTLFPNFAERLKQEMLILAPHAEINVFAYPDRDRSVWNGGSVVTSMESFQLHWITREQYYEIGPNVFYRQFI
jgi:actin-related protein